MNEKIKTWLMRVSPEKVVLAATGITLLVGLGLMVSGVVTHSASLKRAGAIAFIVAFAIACIPLAGFLVMLCIEKVKKTGRNRTSH